jgi:hypothetical protein
MKAYFYNKGKNELWNWSNLIYDFNQLKSQSNELFDSISEVFFELDNEIFQDIPKTLEINVFKYSTLKLKNSNPVIEIINLNSPCDPGFDARCVVYKSTRSYKLLTIPEKRTQVYSVFPYEISVKCEIGGEWLFEPLQNLLKGIYNSFAKKNKINLLDFNCYFDNDAGYYGTQCIFYK